MNLDKDGDTTIASVAKVRESEGDGEEESETEPGEAADEEKQE
jgi:possible DNA topoisomerase (ATP-hydrolyzing)